MLLTYYLLHLVVHAADDATQRAEQRDPEDLRTARLWHVHGMCMACACAWHVHVHVHVHGMCMACACACACLAILTLLCYACT